MSRTPDAISKKRQELGRQLRVMELKLNDLRLKLALTPEAQALRSSQIKFASEQYQQLLDALKPLRKKGEIYYKGISKLQPGVM